MKKSLVVLAVLALAATTAAVFADPAQNWEKLCVKCHGADAKGDTKMGKKLDIKDLTDPKFQASFTDEQAFKAIKEGIKEGDKIKMKAVEGLSDEEIKAMVQHVRGFKK
jgi:cytochrome c553